MLQPQSSCSRCNTEMNTFESAETESRFTATLSVEYFFHLWFCSGFESMIKARKSPEKTFVGLAVVSQLVLFPDMPVSDALQNWRCELKWHDGKRHSVARRRFNTARDWIGLIGWWPPGGLDYWGQSRCESWPAEKVESGLRNTNRQEETVGVNKENSKLNK